MDKWIDGQKNGWIDEWMDERWTDGRIYVCMEEWYDDWMNNRMDELRNG